jgi:hypothetical protein
METFRFARLLLVMPLMLAGMAETPVGQQILWSPAMDPACLGTEKPPELFSHDITAPQTLYLGEFAPPGWNPEWGRLSRGGVQYVSASLVQAKLITDRCSQVSSVRLGTRMLTTTPTDGYWYFTTSEYITGQPGRVAHSVSVHFPKARDGSTDTVTITAGRGIISRLSDVVHYRFPLVRVHRVEAQEVFAPVGISEAEVFNIFGRFLYGQFNGAANSANVQVGGETVRIYGYDPSSMYVTIDSRGVSFGFRFKIDKLCQPRAHVQGRFTLQKTQDGISVLWVVAPYVELQPTTGICQLIELLPLAGLVVDHLIDGGEGSVAGGVQGQIEGAVLAMFADYPAVISPVQGFSTRRDELLVHLDLDAPSVRIQVPYDAFDMVRSGMTFPAGERVAIVASDLSPPDFNGGAGTATLHSGPNGLPRTGTTNWPNALTWLRLGPLVWNDAPVARLLARRDDPQATVTYQYRPTCAVVTGVLPTRIRFGVNDTAGDAQRLRPGSPYGYWVRIFFDVPSPTPLCGRDSSDGVPPPTSEL